MTTMQIDRAVVEQALEALEYAQQGRECPSTTRQAITALRAALAQQAEPVEPVAWMVYTEGGTSAYVTDNPNDLVGAYRALPLYTAPPRREWRSLSEEEIDDLSRTMVKGHKSVNWLTRAIEAGLKEKNNG